jgi:hypothetical protein
MAEYDILKAEIATLQMEIGEDRSSADEFRIHAVDA